MIYASARTIFAVAAIALSCGAAAADKKSDGKLSSSDRQFITTVAQDGMAEVELGKLAQEASSADVKQFAQRMVSDHSKANSELESIASRLGATPPKQVDKKHQDDMKKFQGLSGDKFDREYAQHMVKDHEQAVSLFEKESKKGDSDELKQFASTTLPHAPEEHLKMARGLTQQKK